MNRTELIVEIEIWKDERKIILNNDSICNLADRILDHTCADKDVTTKAEDAPIYRDAYYTVEISAHDMEAMKEIRNYHRKTKPLHRIAFRVLCRLIAQTEPPKE